MMYVSLEFRVVEFKDLLFPLHLLRLGDLLPAVLLLVILLLVLLSARLLHHQLHGLHPQSHLRVHLYFYCVQVVVQILPKANHLTQGVFESFLQLDISDLETDTTIGGSVLHRTRECV